MENVFKTENQEYLNSCFQNQVDKNENFLKSINTFRIDPTF